MKLRTRLWTILTSVSAALLIASSVGTYIAINYGSAAINMLFAIDTTKVIGTTEKMRFESDWGNPNGKGFFNEDKIMTRKAAVEGMTLLWNKDVDGKPALPLQEGNKLSCLSHSSVDIVESGTGSGHIDTVTQTGAKANTTLKDALSRYFEVNDKLWRFYTYGEGSTYTRGKTNYSESGPGAVNEVPWSKYTSEVTDSFSDYNDAAIVFISRTGGENGDLHTSKDGVAEEDGGYLALTQEEKDLLSNITSDKRFKKVILVLNTGNPIMMENLKPYIDNIDAAIYMGEAGTSGVNALAELLVGNESPSGRLSDTLAYSLFSHPSTVNDSKFTYSDIPSGGIESERYQGHYMVYAENIYIGYKYFETRYMDSILNPDSGASSSVGAEASTSGWNYDQEVAFPFGYGLSYSDFSYSDFSVKLAEDEQSYDVSVKVTNTGDVASKEVVQVYLSKPYTQHDKDNDIEVAGVELVGFDKTEKLAPGASEELVINVPKDYFKTYDANYKNEDSEGRYVLEAGDYYLTAATDSHVAANNILAAHGKTPSPEKVMAGQRDVSMGKDFATKLTLEEDTETYKVSRQTGEEIHNQLSQMDMNRYDGRGDNHVTYLSRKDWDGTYPEPVTIKFTDDMSEDLAITHVSPKNEPDKMPTYSKFASGSTDGKPDVHNGDLVAADFIDAPLNEYDERWNEDWDKKWNQLLDQMSWNEQATICANAYHQLNGAESVALPSSRQENGPVGITKRGESNWQIPNDNVKDWNYVCYPSGPVLASTFNTDIVEQVGQHMSEDMLYLGYNGIYGPGGNLHPSPFGGRNWEYYSEDPILSGLTGAAQCRGIENKGNIAYVKHFAFNDMETYRHYCGIFSNEQAARENYLRAFEIIFTDGGASGTMNSFTRVGFTWSGMCKELQTNILRQEWGWDGINITDWIENKFMSKPDAILAGTNSFDGNGTPSTYFGGYENDPDFAAKLRESTKIIIYNVVSTHTFNGLTRESIVETVTPWWQIVLYSVIALFSVATAGCGAMLTITLIMSNKKRREEASQGESK